MDKVLSLLDAIAILEPDLRDYIYSNLKTIRFGKSDPVVRLGEVPRYLGYIEKGLIRGYRIDGKDHQFTSWFMKEGDIYASVRAFFRQIRATETVEALEPTIIRCLSFDQYKFALDKWASFQRHRAEILEKYYLQSDEREEMRQQEAYQRFCFLMEHYSDLVDRVQDQYLASFLGLTPSYYSFVKGQYFSRNPRR